MARRIRVVEIVRVSRYDDGLSPVEQRKRLADARKMNNELLVETIEELDVSGTRTLAKRPGLTRAIELIEAGRADVLRVAYFDRLVRSFKVQVEVVERVEATAAERKRKGLPIARVHAVDVGNITSDSAAGWLTSAMLGIVAEYQARSARERVASNVVEAIAKGRVPFVTPFGLRRLADGAVEPGDLAWLVAEAFERRARGATIAALREFFVSHGHPLAKNVIRKMLTQRLYVGELHYGEHVNLNACEPIVDRDVFDRVQRLVVRRGRQPKHHALLNQLGVLCCGECVGRMSLGSIRARTTYRTYRCTTPDCPGGVSISADSLESLVLDETVRLLADAHGRASINDELDALRIAAEHAQDALSRGLRVLAEFDDEDDAREQLRALKAARDEARERYDELRDTIGPDETFDSIDLLDDDITLDDRRRAIVRALARIDIKPATRRGRGFDESRVKFWPRGSEPTPQPTMG